MRTNGGKVSTGGPPAGRADAAQSGSPSGASRSTQPDDSSSSAGAAAEAAASRTGTKRGAPPAAGEAAVPGVEGGEGDALAPAEGGDGPAAAAEAVEVVESEVAGGGVAVSGHGGVSQAGRQPTSLPSLSRT